MKIFILSIIKNDYYDSENSDLISKASMDVCNRSPLHVRSFRELKHVMDQFPNEEFVIFSNFASSSNDFQFEPHHKDTYEYTAIMFQNICMRYPVKAIHLITGAPEFVVLLELVQLLTRNPPQITYKSIMDFPKLDFHAKRREYIVDKINLLKSL